MCLSLFSSMAMAEEYKSTTVGEVLNRISGIYEGTAYGIDFSFEISKKAVKVTMIDEDETSIEIFDENGWTTVENGVTISTDTGDTIDVWMSEEAKIYTDEELGEHIDVENRGLSFS